MFKVLKISTIALIIFFSSIALCSLEAYANDVNGIKAADDSYTLKTGISMIEQVPNSFYGSWRVTAKLAESSGDGASFKPTSTDLWNLSRENNVINLSNPFTGASASITVSYVDNGVIKFSKTGNYDNKRLTDTVELRLSGDSFSGINKLSLETLSDVNNQVIKTQNAVYIIKGEKISGTSILGK